MNNRTVLKVKNDNDGWNIIKHHRAISKAYNLRERANELMIPGYEPVFMRVTLFGRLGKNNPNRSKYSTLGRTSWRNPAQRIALADAAEIAVYINPMKKYPATSDWPIASYNLTSKPFNIHK